MKNSMTRWMIAAAALAVAAGSASAQNLKADIELTFRAGDKLMQPGNYEVSINQANRVVRLRNLDTNDSAVVIATYGKDAPKAWREQGKPVIAFACSQDGKCSLSHLWNGRESFEDKFPSSEKARGERSTAEVVIPMTRAD